MFWTHLSWIKTYSLIFSWNKIPTIYFSHKKHPKGKCVWKNHSPKIHSRGRQDMHVQSFGRFSPKVCLLFLSKNSSFGWSNYLYQWLITDKGVHFIYHQIYITLYNFKWCHFGSTWTPETMVKRVKEWNFYNGRSTNRERTYQNFHVNNL